MCARFKIPSCVACFVVLCASVIGCSGMSGMPGMAMLSGASAGGGAMPDASQIASPTPTRGNSGRYMSEYRLQLNA